MQTSNYRIVALLAMLTVLTISCQKEHIQGKDDEQADRAGSGKLKQRKQATTLQQINFTVPNLFPEGVVYDPFRNLFYVSSATMGVVGTVTTEGVYTPFITDELLTSSTGFEVDKARKRLLVSNVESGLGAYDLNTGLRIYFADLSVLLPGVPLFVNDVALDPQGNAYVTNSAAGVIYKIDRTGQATVFFHNDAFTLPPGAFGFNGIEYDERGFLLVAFADQIVKIPIRDPSAYSIVNLDAPVSGDGLLLSKDGKQLIVVHNTGGTPEDNVLSFTSNDQWESGSLQSSYSTGAVFPTTVTSDGKHIYVLYSHLDKLLSGQDHNTFTIQAVPLAIKSPF